MLSSFNLTCKFLFFCIYLTLFPRVGSSCLILKTNNSARSPPASWEPKNVVITARPGKRSLGANARTTSRFSFFCKVLDPGRLLVFQQRKRYKVRSFCSIILCISSLQRYCGALLLLHGDADSIDYIFHLHSSILGPGRNIRTRSVQQCQVGPGITWDNPGIIPHLHRGKILGYCRVDC